MISNSKFVTPTHDATMVTIGQTDIPCIRLKSRKEADLAKKFIAKKLTRQLNVTVGKLWGEHDVLVIILNISNGKQSAEYLISPTRAWLDNFIETTAIGITFELEIVVWFKDFDITELRKKIDDYNKVGLGI